MYSLAVSDFTSMLVIVFILGFKVSSFHRASDMAYWLKLPVAKSDDLNSISWIHVVEENQIFLSCPLTSCAWWHAPYPFCK